MSHAERGILFYRSCIDVLAGRSRHAFLTMILAAIVGLILINLIGSLIFAIGGPETSEGSSSVVYEITQKVLVGALLVAPILESLIVWVTVWLLRSKIGLGRVMTVMLSGLLSVPLHGLAAASWAVLPGFALHTLIFMNWRERGNARRGFFVIVGAHFLQNAGAVLLP